MDWKELLDKDPTGLLQKLTTKQTDPLAQHRKAVLKNIERSRAAHRDNKNKGGLHKRVGDFAKVEVRVGRNPVRTVPVNGKPFGMVPYERLPAFLDGFHNHVASGGLDNDLRAATSGSAPAARSTGQRRKRGPMSPEALAARNAKRAATLAAKKGS